MKKSTATNRAASVIRRDSPISRKHSITDSMLPLSNISDFDLFMFGVRSISYPFRPVNLKLTDCYHACGFCGLLYGMLTAE